MVRALNRGKKGEGGREKRKWKRFWIANRKESRDRRGRERSRAGREKGGMQ